MADDRTLLVSAAAAQAPLHLISLRREHHVVARLAEVEDDGLTVALPDDHGLAMMDMVNASFSFDGRTWSFLSHVRDIEGDCAWLSMPASMISADQRLAPRHAVTLPIEVELLGAHPECRPTLVDLAVTGMQVKVERRLGLMLGERLPAVLRLGDLEIELVAELRRENGAALGFYFPDSVRKGRLHPPAALVALVERLRHA